MARNLDKPRIFVVTNFAALDVAPSTWAGYPWRLDIQVLYVEGVVFDELAAGLYVFAHQRCEDGFAFGDVFQLYRE